MTPFTSLLERLILSPSRTEKLRLMADYFAANPDPDRGWALAAITGDLEIASVKPAALKALVAERVDAELFAMSYDYVGDLSETIALIWPTTAPSGNLNMPLSQVVEKLQTVSKREAPQLMVTLLDQLGEADRWALLKLVTGGLRIGVSARLAKQALAQFGNQDVNEIEALWHGLTPPYTALFHWLEGRSEKPENLARAPFTPVMLSHPVEEDKTEHITPDAFAAEWKWDGIRVQAVSDRGEKRLYTRTGDDISKAFPDVVSALTFDGVIDGELLVMRPDETGLEKVAPFSDLQQRLNRKTVSAKLMASHPAFIRAYDLLIEGKNDLRDLPFIERRARLEKLVKEGSDRLDLSPQIAFSSALELDDLRQNPPHPAIEGVMLKRFDSPYLIGRPKGHWYKWKRDPHLIDAVVLYAQRGHGKRSSFYSDFTFGVWQKGESGLELVPVGKAYSGFTDEELKKLDRFVRQNTTNRFGPVREVTHTLEKGLVVEVAFEGLNASTRHKSGVAMRFPRFHRLRWDKPPSEADSLESLKKLLPD